LYIISPVFSPAYFFSLVNIMAEEAEGDCGLALTI